jgi:hypothetical protein
MWLSEVGQFLDIDLSLPATADSKLGGASEAPKKRTK